MAIFRKDKTKRYLKTRTTCLLSMDKTTKTEYSAQKPLTAILRFTKIKNNSIFWVKSLYTTDAIFLKKRSCFFNYTGHSLSKRKKHLEKILLETKNQTYFI